MDTMTMTLTESMGSLVKMESFLNAQRAAIVNHCVEPSISGAAKYFSFLSKAERYAVDESAYRKELDSFLNLLKSASDILKDSPSAAVPVETVEIKQIDFASIATSPVAEVYAAAYSQDESDGSTSSRQFAESLNRSASVDDAVVLGVPEPAQAMMHRESVDITVTPRTNDYPALPVGAGSSGPRTRTEARVSRNVAVINSHNNDGKWFGVWKDNHGRKMHTATELYCTETFGSPSKLKRYLVTSGGFEAKQIRSVRVFQVVDRDTGRDVYHARIFVEGSMESVARGIERIEIARWQSGKGKLIWVSRMQQNDRSNKLMVKNFDILTAADHREFTKQFLKFGALQCDVKMGRNRDGVNYAEVTYREVDGAQWCERTQNDDTYRSTRALMTFNGRALMIGYAAQTENKKTRNRRRYR